MIADTVKLELTHAEAAFCLALGEMRMDGKPIKGYTQKDSSKLSQGAQGVMGEFAVAKVYGGIIDVRIYRGGDGHRPDVLLDDGRLVEVKAIHNAGRNPRLILDHEEYAKSTWYCPVILVPPAVAHVGPLLHVSVVKSVLNQKNELPVGRDENKKWAGSLVELFYKQKIWDRE